MKSRTEVTTAFGRVTELGFVTIGGVEHCAGGSIIDLEKGQIFGYVKRTAEGTGLGTLPERYGRFVLTTWEGAEICPIYFLREHRRYTPQGYAYKMTSYYMYYAGKRWHGRSGENGTCVRMFAGKKRTP